MLAITKCAEGQSKVEANVLPCKIGFNGAVNASERYWKPSNTANDGKTAYFRGRKLLGREIAVPKGYEGVVVQKTNTVLAPDAQQVSDESLSDVEDEAPIEVREAKQVASFKTITVWDHEALPSASTDPYVRGIEEWMTLANSIHSYDKPA